LQSNFLKTITAKYREDVLEQKEEESNWLRNYKKAFYIQYSIVYICLGNGDCLGASIYIYRQRDIIEIEEE